MSEVRVPAGASLQSAIDAAQAGDVIRLEAGAVFQGQFTLPPKPGVVTLTTDAPLPDGRISESTPLASLYSGYNNTQALLGHGATNWKIDGIAGLPDPSGGSNFLELQDAEHITIDRFRIVVPEGQRLRRAIVGNGKAITLTRSLLTGIWRIGGESQAFCAWDGAGPYTITNNGLEAASMSIMFGGSKSLASDRIPSDILIEGNDCFKRLSWRTDGIVRTVKNLLELKSAKRVTIRQNTLDGCWEQSQSGYAIQFTVRNDDEVAPWSVVEDVLCEQNVIRNSERGINVLGMDSYHPSGQLTRLFIRDNDIQSERRVLNIGSEVGVLEYTNNRSTNTEVLLYEGSVWPAGDVAARLARYAVSKFTFYGNSAQALSFEGTFPERANLETMVGEFITWDVPPPPPPPPPPSDTDVISPDVRIAVLHRIGSSPNWNVRAESTATDIAKVEFYVNSRLKQTVTNAPYGTTLNLKNYRGDVTVSARAYDKAGNPPGTASRTVVLP